MIILLGKQSHFKHVYDFTHQYQQSKHLLGWLEHFWAQPPSPRWKGEDKQAKIAYSFFFLSQNTKFLIVLSCSSPLPCHWCLWSLLRYHSCRIWRSSRTASAEVALSNCNSLNRCNMGLVYSSSFLTHLLLTIIVAFPISGPSVFWYGSSVLPIIVILEAFPMRYDAISIPE